MSARPAPTSESSGVPSTPPESAHQAGKGWILLVISTAWLMVLLDSTIVSVALPSAQRALGFSAADRQWVVTAYSLAFGCLLLVGGRLSDILGRKRAFQIGMVGFAVASVTGGAATSFAVLIVARAAQGIFGALITPPTLGLLATTFTGARERARAFATYSAISVVGGAAGLLLGGILTQYLSWRWCLYVNVLFGVVGIIGAVLLLPPDQVVDRAKGPGGRWDIPGSIVSVVGLAAIVYGFAEASLHGWGSPVAYGLIAAGGVLLGCYVLLERLVPHPLTPLRLFDRTRGVSYLARTVAGIGAGGFYIIITYYFQSVLEYSALTTGLAFLPFVGGYVVSSQIVQRWALARYGPKVLVSVLLLAGAFGLAWLSRIGPHTSFGSIAPALVLFGFGIGGPIVASTSLGVAVTDPRDVGPASAVTSATLQIGQSVGAGLLNTIAVIASANYLAARGGAHSAAVSAAAHGDGIALVTVAAILAGTALVTGLLYPRTPTR